MLTAFEVRRAASEENRAAAGPILGQLFAAWVEAVGTDSQAVLYRHFVGNFPQL